MREKNVHGEWRVITPVGYTKGFKPFLFGANITDDDGNYKGWWAVEAMSKAIRKELQKELEGRWLPANYDQEAL